MKRGSIKLPPPDLSKSRAQRARGDKLIGEAAVGTTAAVAATVSAIQVVMVAMIITVVAITTSYAVTTSIDRSRISDLEDAPPVEGGNQTALDEIQEQIDEAQEQNNAIVAAIMDAKEMITEIIFLVVGQLWVSELIDPPFVPFIGAGQLLLSTGIPGFNNAARWRVAEFYGAAPIWNVSVTAPFVTLDIVNSPHYFQSVRFHGIFLENGTYSVSIHLEGTCDHPFARGRCEHFRWFTVIPPSAMTSMDGLDGTVDFAGNSAASDAFSLTYLWDLRVAEILTASVTPTPPGIVAFPPAMSNGILNIPPEGAHVHMLVFADRFKTGEQSYTTFKVTISKFEI